MSTDDSECNESTGVVCPTCETECASENGLRIHHSTAHDEPLISDEQILDEIRELADSLGHTPTQREMNDYGRHTTMPATNRFGSWNTALQKAGLEVNKEVNISDERLLDYLRGLADELGHTPSGTDVDYRGVHSSATYHIRFGSWNEALKKAGLEIANVKNYDKEVLINDLIELGDELGRPPTMAEMNDVGKHDRKTYHRAFGTWTHALDEAGYEVDVRGRKPTEYASVYSHGWRSVREDAIQRDGEMCRGCLVTREKHRDESGSDLNVHHIRPAKSFPEGDWGAAHDIENLVTLCDSCHYKWEGVPVAPQ